MSETPKHCDQCGGNLDTIKQEPWVEILMCRECRAEFTVTFGDQLGGGPFCTVEQTKKGKPKKKKYVQGPRARIIPEDALEADPVPEAEPEETAQEIIEKALDGADYERGAIEELNAGARLNRQAFGRLMQCLIDKRLLTISDVRKIAGRE